MVLPLVDVYDDPEKLKEDMESAQIVFNNYNRSKDKLVDNKRDQWKEWYLAYRMIIDKKADDSRTVIADETIYTNVEDILPRIVATGPRVEVWPATNDENDGIRAGQARNIILYDWRKLDLVYTIMEFVKSAEIFGTAFLKVTWDKRVEKRGKRSLIIPGGPAGIADPNNPPKAVLGPIEIKKVQTWNDPKVELCAIDEVFPDPDRHSIESAAWVIHRVPSDLQSVKSARLRGKPLYSEEVVAKLEKMSKEGGNPIQRSHERQTLEEMRNQRFNQSDTESPDQHKFEFHLLEMWSRSKVVTVIEELRGLPPLRNEWNELGEIPFVKYTPIPDIRGMYGISVAETLFAHTVERGTMRAARLDAINYMVHQVYLIRKGSGINPKQLRFNSGVPLFVNQPDDISVMDRGNMPTAIYRELENVDRSIERVGQTRTAQGLSSEGSITATEAQSLEAASGSRTGLMFIILSIQSLTRLGKLLIRLNELYLDGPRFHRITGDDYADTEWPSPGGQVEKITPEGLHLGSGLDMDITVDISAAEPGGKLARLTQARNGLQDVAQILPPDHPYMEQLLILMGDGLGMEQPEKLLRNDRAARALAAQRAAKNPNANAPASGNAETPAQDISSNLGRQQGGSL